MKIFYMEWISVGKKDLEAAFIAEGHTLVYPSVSIEGKTNLDIPAVEAAWETTLQKEVPDIVFSVNYYPVISDFCRKKGIRYISWIYDCPFRRLYSHSVLNPCNEIYVFDKRLYEEFRGAGISTVHHMPLAADTERLDAIQVVGGEDSSFLYDVSFVGSLYLEIGSPFAQMAASLPAYAKGYLDAVMAAQLQIQGYDLVSEILSPVMQDMCKAYPMVREPGGIETEEYFYTNYVIDRQLTAIERIDLLDAVAREYKVDLFTHCKGFTLPGLCNHGRVDYYTEMPLVFKQSKVNLNISLRSIQSGIPLRAFDIMGCGGFLLSDHQAELAELFVPGEDFVYYENKEDLLRKIGYYLRHEDERKAIAQNGHDKVAAEHTYRHRIREMLSF